jgi:hypothetical protein
LMGLAVMSLPIAMRELALKVRRVSRERTSE